MKPLTPKQQKFVDEYMVDFNAAQAARRAGYSAKTARAQGARLLKHPVVGAAIEERRARQAERAGITAEELIDIATQVVRAHPKSLYDENGKMLPPHKWTQEAAVGVAGFEVVENREGGVVTKVKQADRLRATETLLKLFGPVVTERLEITGAGGGPVQAEHYSDIEIGRNIAFALAKGVQAAGMSVPVTINAQADEVIEVDDPPPAAIPQTVEIKLAERLPGGRQRWAVIDRATGANVRDCATEEAARKWAIENYSENESD